MMEKDNISIALECFDVKEEDMVKVAQAVRQINNVGFCVEHYHAIEQLQPGIFKDINPKMLTQKPSSIKRSVAVEAINSSAIIDAVATGVIAGSAAALFFKLVEWISKKLGGGKNGGTSSPEQVLSEHKAILKKLEDKKLKNQELFKKVTGDLDGIMDSLRNKHNFEDKVVSQIHKNIMAAKSPIELLCIIAISKSMPGNDKWASNAMVEMSRFKGEDIIRYNLCLKEGVRGIVTVFEDTELKNVNFSKLQRIAKDLADTLRSADKFITHQTDGSLNTFVTQANNVSEMFKKIDTTQSKSEINAHATKQYSFSATVADFAMDHADPTKGRLDKVDPTSSKNMDIIKDAYACKNILNTAIGSIKGKSNVEIDNKEHNAKFKKSVGELHSVITGLIYYTSMADRMNKYFTLYLNRYIGSSI